MAVELDAPVLPDAGATDALRCDGCFTSERQVVGEGLGARVDYRLTVEDCFERLRCTVDGAERSCFVTPEPALRVYLDADGYVQLIFASPTCGGPWAGSYASEGGGFPVTATVARP